MTIQFTQSEILALLNSSLLTAVNDVFTLIGVGALIPRAELLEDGSYALRVERTKDTLVLGSHTYALLRPGDEAPSKRESLPSWIAPHLESLARGTGKSLKRLAQGSEAKLERSILTPVFAALAWDTRDDISMRKLAKTCHRTPGYLGTQFQNFTGYSFREILSLLRVKLVWDGLNTDGGMASQQGFESGFGSVSQLNRSFKKLTMVTPSSLGPISGQLS